MYLDKSNKTLQLVLAAAKTTLDCHFSGVYSDTKRDAAFLGTQFTGRSNGLTIVTVVPAPGDITGREIPEFFFYNADTAPVTVILQYFDGTTTTIIKKTTLNAGQTLTYEQFYGWQVN